MTEKSSRDVIRRETKLWPTVLEPGDDPAARDALREYAAETEDDDLAADLTEWADSLEERDSE